MKRETEINTFKFGIVSAVEAQSIPLGSLTKDTLNFITRGDKMELRRGYARLGQTDSGIGKITGIGVGTRLDSDGTQLPFWSRGRKIEYYDQNTDDRVEVSSDVLPVGASGEDIEFSEYQSQAGAQLFASSPNSSIYKIMLANPGSITDLASTTYRGYIKIKQSRTFLWNRKDANGRKDEQNVYNSYIDNRQFTTVTAESIGTGDGLTKTFNDTLAFKAGGNKRTCFGIKVYDEDSVEVFIDDRDGNLVGSLGGTGTINYTSGVISVTFASAPANLKDIRVDYQWEDSTNQGIADFSFSATRTAGQGNFFPQGDGGPCMAVETYGPDEFCGHKYNIYDLNLGSDDTSATNLLFRAGEGVPNHRAMKATSLGIVYVDAKDPAKPQIKLLSLQRGSTAIDGVSISKNIDLSGFTFDEAYIVEFDDFIGIGCKTNGSTVNNRMWLRSKVWGSWDLVEFFGTCGAVYTGALLLGDSLSNNVLTAFSGVDDDGAAITGQAVLNIWNVGYKDHLKKMKLLQIEGDIGPDQVIDVDVSLDRGAFVTVGQIKGSGSYVDRSQRVDVGSLTLGRGEVAGGSDGIEAYHYFWEISPRLDRFENMQIRLKTGVDADNNNADGIGYFSFTLVRPDDIRIKSQRIPRKYRQ